VTEPSPLTETDLLTIGRHPAVAQVMRWFAAGHLPAGDVRVASEMVAQLANDMADAFPDGGPELTTGLRKLLEAKDCFVRCAVAASTPRPIGEGR
jgi:hypothetical protein